MAHTTRINETSFVHNGDYSGDVVIINWQGRIEIPFKDLETLVINAWLEEKMTFLQSLSDEDLKKHIIEKI